MHFSVDSLVRLAKRDNNTIRPYLYVNPMQGKHIPTNPEEVLDMCFELAKKVNVTYPNDRLYVIGFAETATGIASAISHYLNNVVYYQNTTREYKDGEVYLYFTESHSHATDQMLRSSNLSRCLSSVDRVLFVDDEVTTGNTICKLINRIKEYCIVPNLKFSIVSVLNSVPKERLLQMEDDGIDCLFLSELPFEYKKDSIINIEYDECRDIIINTESTCEIDEIVFSNTNNVREVTRFSEYDDAIQSFSNAIDQVLANSHFKDVLIIGTEEFMYPTFVVGQNLIKHNITDSVKVHSTTRSPIIASGQNEYPLTTRYQIKSFYDELRTTYIYNLKKYDKVIIVTDAIHYEKGVSDLNYALESVGNHNILLARWIYE